MSSALRNLQRRALRKRPDHEVAPQPTEVLPDGGYKTLTRKGWRVFKAARLAAQRRMAHLLDHVLRPPRKRYPRDVYRFQKRQAPKSWPGTETRQQRRWAARRG